jgi:site-specific recombinase XerD
MKVNMSVLNWLNKARMNQSSGKVPIYVRVTVQGKRAEISTGKSILPEQWIVNAGRMKGSSEETRTINHFLDTVSVRLHKIFEEINEEGGIVTSDEIKQRYLGHEKKTNSLIMLFEQHNDLMKGQIGKGFSQGTWMRYVITLKHLKAYLKAVHKADDFTIEKLNYSFISDLEYFLKVKKNIGHNTAMKYLKNVKKIVLLARKYQWIDHDPFINFKVTQVDVNKDYLTMDEITAIREKEFSIDRLGHVRDVFIFCCYTGLSYSDVLNLTIKDIHVGLDGENWIVINRKKTGVQSNIPLLPEAMKLIDRYKNSLTSEVNGKLFPVTSNQKMNAYLKEIGDVCAINKKMTFHMARHTFATTITLSNGVSMETVGSMLGHKNLKTTQIYAKVVQDKVSREMKQLKAILHG